MITPVLHAKGQYTLAAPWSTVEGRIYECIAIRAISDFVDRGQDVLAKVYAPKNLGQTELTADIERDAKIITLTSPGVDPIYVPDTYITAAPAMDGVPYSHVLLSVSLGAIPDGMALDHLNAQVAAAVEAAFGITPQVNVHVAASTGFVNQDQHNAWELARQAKITNSSTDRARLLEAQRIIDAQSAENAALVEKIKQLSPP